MLSGTMMQTGLALLLLLAGVADDLRSRKVHNLLTLLGFVLGLGCVIAIQGLSGFMVAGLSLLTAIAAVLPLYMIKAIGGGDVKLFLAVSVLLNWQQVLIALLGSLVWGSLLGIFQVVLKGEGKAFLHNLLAVFNRAKLPEQKTHKVPFTIALLFGFLTSFVWTGVL
jgi:prepilin peptidase CpaA